MGTMTAGSGSSAMDTDLWQCLVCQQWMEQRYLDEDQICIDCNELEGKNDLEEKRDWQEFEPYC